jgi:ribonuclease BN (tRNA processing enzyme)
MGMIRFHILGAGGAVPTPSHSPAAYWVTVDRHSLLVDLGPGALVRLVKSGEVLRGTDDIDRVLLTHLHPDHSGDLVALLFALHSPVPESTAPFVICGPVGLNRLLEQLRGIYGSWLDPRLRQLVVRELEPGAVLDHPGGGRVEAFAVDHPQDRLSTGCLGYRFFDADGRLAVFSGDTGPCPGLEEAARGADLLVIECSTPDELATPGHLAPRDVGHICQAARPRQVVLTHQYPAAAALDLAAAVGKYYQGQVEQARDGSVYVVGPETEEETQ